MKRQGGLCAGALVLGACGSLLFGGPLNPPMGPVVPTGKTLTEVEPRTAINATNTPGNANSVYRISQPGSYYLTGNVTGEFGKNGIEIAAGDVTVELNGFALQGVAGSLNGITSSGSESLRVRVCNGAVRGWGAVGISLGLEGCSIVDVRAAENVSIGMLTGSGGRVIGCTAMDNGSHGIITSFGSTITGCVASGNGGVGIFANSGGSTVNGCSATANSTGITVVGGGTAINCTAYGNEGDGIVANSGSTVKSCTAYSNAENGIQADTGCTVAGCTAYSNDEIGMVAGVGSTVVDCTARTNTMSGIQTSDDSSVSRCVASGNGRHGISVSADCAVFGNTCNGNGTGTGVTDGAGVRTTGANNRVEGNNCSNNDRGFETAVGSTLNLFIRNSASSNTINYVFVANNRYGPILDITSATAAVSGNSAASTVSTTDPHANFRY